MTGLQILHWSDLHFAGARVGSQLEPARAIHLAVEAVQRDFGAQQFLLAISGDITTAGLSSGYDAARDALTAAGKALNLVKIVVCPGNHDIGNLNPRSFTAFNRFALQVTGDADQAWDFANPVRTLRAGDHEILAVNTSYLGDHRVGSAPLAALRVALKESKGPHRIVLLHHSPISSGYAGGGMADAYELLSLVSSFDVTAVLHGHVHSDQGLRFGQFNTLLFGAGSLGSEPDPNMNNQFAVHELAHGVVRQTRVYRYYRNSDQFEGVSL